MLQVARLAPTLLEDAAGSVIEFLQSQIHTDGGMKDRAGDSDLYYTVFGLECLIALRSPLPEDGVRAYLMGFGDGEGLDFVHRSCLARCWACLGGQGLSRNTAQCLAGRIEDCRSADGGYAADPGTEQGTLYHSFLALGAYQDLGLELPGPMALCASAEGLRTKDGAYANMAGMPIGTTPSTAAAITLLRQLDRPPPSEAAEWLLARAHPEGGFVAVPGIPMPDLLSTATTLHALSGMKVSFEHLKESCLNFVDTLWTGKAFCGSWEDEEQDCEYTYYALLALGHLSL